MSGNGLAKLYDRLTAKERATLLLSAVVRRDEVEKQRLLASAPLVPWRIGHHCGHVRAAWMLTALARHEHLAAVADFWFAMTNALFAEGDVVDQALADAGVPGEPTRRDAAESPPKEQLDPAAERRRWKAIADVTLFKLKRECDAWRQACEQLGIPAEYENEFGDGSVAFGHTLQRLEENAPTGDELQSALRELGGDDITPTAADPSGWLKMFEQLAALPISLPKPSGLCRCL